MTVASLELAAAGAAAGLLLASFGEYWFHFLLHRQGYHAPVKGGRRERRRETWLRQFARCLAVGTLPTLAFAGVCGAGGFWPAGAGFAAGALAWFAWNAYAHTLQHQKPELVFWMPRPVHHLHERHDMAGHNFGVSVDWWDRVFKTYEPAHWVRPIGTRRTVWRLLAIRWA